MKDTLVNVNDTTPDRRFWTTYDHWKFEQEARALRNAAMVAMLRRGIRRVGDALSRAGAQPPKPRRAASA